MLLTDTPINLAKGGTICRYCKFWCKYNRVQKEDTGFVGDWGECESLDMKAKAISDPQYFIENEKERLNTDIEKYSMFNVCLSTTDTYGCSNFREKKDDENEFN